MYAIFGESADRRRAILMQWHTTAPSGGGGGAGARLWPIFADFIKRVLLYDGPPRLSIRHDHFCLLDANGLRVPYTWLTDDERHYVAYELFAQRTTLFKTRKTFPNGEFVFNDCIHDGPRLFDWVWGRQMVRDFAWIVVAQRSAHMLHELIVATQHLMVDHARGRKDVFLRALHAGMQGSRSIARVPCWGLTQHDLHPEERENKL